MTENTVQVRNTADVIAPIISVLIRSGVSAADFLAAAKLAYALAAETEIAKAKQRPSVSRIAALTGLIRREIRQLLNSSKPDRYVAGISQSSQPLKRVLRAWSADGRFSDRQGKPRQLPLTRGPSSFEALVKSHGGDVTVIAVLKELERIGCVRRVGAKRVELVRQEIAPPQYNANAMKNYASQLTDFMQSIQLPLNGSEVTGFFQSRDSYEIPEALLPVFHKTFSERASNLLESFETWAKKNAVTSNQGDRQRVAIGIYISPNSLVPKAASEE